jgi:beta-glucosidase
VSAREFTRGKAVEVSAEVANTGTVAADEVVQLYVRDVVAGVARPVRELKGFRKIRLKPGEKQTVTFSLSSKDLAFYDQSMQLVTEDGEFHAWIAPDAASGVPVSFRLESGAQPQ